MSRAKAIYNKVPVKCDKIRFAEIETHSFPLRVFSARIFWGFGIFMGALVVGECHDL